MIPRCEKQVDVCFLVNNKQGVVEQHMYISMAIDCTYKWTILIRNINASTKTVRGSEDLS